MSFFGECLHCSSLVMAVLIAMFVGSICLPTQLPILQIDEGGSAPEAQDELKLKHVTNPSIQAPEFEHIGDMTVYHPLGDELDETREKRNAVNDPRQLWPDGVVPYEIAPAFSSRDREVILRSMKHWEDNTCVRFRPKVSSDIYSIYIERTPGCSSFVGRIPRFYQPQGVSLGPGCVYDSVVIHELGHAIGFYHEHTRPDRDEYIDVIYGNIQSRFEDQFYKFQPGQTNTLGLGYDLQSIMHYRRNAFSKDGSDTIRAKNPSVTSFGNSRQLSSLDIAKARALYNCPVTVQKCGTNFTTSSGSFQTPNWPETYPVNIDCEWRIQLPDARKLVELRCDYQPFGIAGALPSCSLDRLKLYDGHSKQDTSYGPYCHFTPPEILKMSSNLAMAVFHAGPSHNPSRRGFRCTFQSVEAPAILPPTPPPITPPPIVPPPCGGVLNTDSGSFQTPNWPETYPNSVECQWTIELPDSSNLVELKCDHQPFGIAGNLPACDRDYLKIYDGHSTQDTSHGPFCHFTPPDTIKMSSNKAMAVFRAGSSHSPSRKGFRCTFQSLPPPSLPQCGGVLTASSGSFQTENWPSTYPVNVDCQWTIRLQDSNRRVQLTFETPFGIAGSLPACEKDYLRIYDDRADRVHGPYCYFTLPPRLTMSSNEARVVFYAGPSHSPSRVGFKANYQSVV